MTVAELIEKLRELPQDIPVMWCDFESYTPVEEVEHELAHKYLLVDLPERVTLSMETLR